MTVSSLVKASTILLAFSQFTVFQSQNAAAQGAPPAPTVSVSSPIQKRITQWDEYTGRFEAAEQVEVRPRVSGFIEKIHFRDGQPVKKGDLLFTIDQRPYQLTVDVAKAEVLRAKAQVQLAENEVERGEGLTRNQVITVREVDTRRSNLIVARASQQSAEANLKTAELNLEWTQVRAPISGRASDKRIDIGNLVAGGQSGTTLLTTIVSLDPIHFIFDASEADYLRYSRQASSGDRPSSRDVSNPVEVKLADETRFAHAGKMNFVDNQLNARAGTIRGRAVFDNKDEFLTPGIFGRLRLYSGDIDALLLPDTALVSDQTSKVVFTVGPDNKIVPKPVIQGPMVDGLRVIKSGLTTADKVVINGIANPMVRPGAVVNPQQGEIKAAAN